MDSENEERFKYIMDSYQLLQSGFDWSTTMHIPFRAVSPNSITHRFIRMKVFSEDKFVFLELEVNKAMTSEIINLLKNLKGARDWYFEGPQGIGKSFAFLHLVLVLRRFYKHEFRVIYINNPHEWKKSSWRYILNEVIYTFAEDEEKFSNTFTLKQWYERLWKAEADKRKDMLQGFLEAAEDYCKKQGLKLLGVLDQENEVANLRDQGHYPFPFDFYDRISGSKYLITCASADNWSSVKKSQSWQNLRSEIKISLERLQYQVNYNFITKSMF